MKSKYFFDIFIRINISTSPFLNTFSLSEASVYFLPSPKFLFANRRKELTIKVFEHSFARFIRLRTAKLDSCLIYFTFGPRVGKKKIKNGITSFLNLQIGTYGGLGKVLVILNSAKNELSTINK
jgi:hypothetical protein